MTANQTPASKGTVLIVDDEEDILEILAGLLADEGLEVVRASDGEQGLAKFAAGQFDAVMTDIKMPRMDGLTFLEKIRERGSSVPVVILTGYGDKNAAVRALRAGAMEFLEKGDVFNQVAALIPQLVNLGKKIREIEASNLPEEAKALKINLEKMKSYKRG